MFTTPQQVFDAMPAAFRPQKAGATELALQFNVSGDEGGEWTVEIGDGVCKTSPGQADDPIAIIDMSGRDFLAVFGGKLNAVAAYMSGRIKVSGDVMSIMHLLSFFEMPQE